MLVPSYHAVKQEGIDVIIQRLVIQEELGKQAQITTPSALPPAIDLKEAHKVVAIDLIAGRVTQFAFRAMPLKGLPGREVRQTEFVPRTQDLRH